MLRAERGSGMVVIAKCLDEQLRLRSRHSRMELNL